MGKVNLETQGTSSEKGKRYPSFLRRPPKISEEEAFEFDSYIKSLANASDRVRHVLLVSVVASIVVLAALLRSSDAGWWKARVGLIKLTRSSGLLAGCPSNIGCPDNAGCPGNNSKAPDKEVPLVTSAVSRDEIAACWDSVNDLESKIKYYCLFKGCSEQDQYLSSQKDMLGKLHDRCDQLRVRRWLWEKEHTCSSFEIYASEIEKLNTGEVLLVGVPFVGIKFDINDLGMLSAIGLAVIAVTLLFATVRHHESLYLCLWKVRRIAEAENRYDDGQGKANFLYHALAMTQVFSRPPTLARWGKHRISMLFPLAFFLSPVVVHALVFLNDSKTAAIGLSYNPDLVGRTYYISLIAGIILIVTVVMSIGFEIAAATRWENTFYVLNPALRMVARPSIFSWIFPRRHPKIRFLRASAEGISGNKLRLLDLNSGESWLIPLERDAAPASLGIENINPEPWLFSPLVQDDNRYYQIKWMSDGGVEILECKDDIELKDDAWTVRNAAVVQEGDAIFEAVGDRVIKFSRGEKPKIVFQSNASAWTEGGGTLGTLDIAVFERDVDRHGKPVVGFVDKKETVLFLVVVGLKSGSLRLLSVGSSEFHLNKKLETDAAWKPHAVTAMGEFVFIAEVKRRRWFEWRVRLRVQRVPIDSLLVLKSPRFDGKKWVLKSGL